MTNEITLPWPGWTVTKLLGAGGYGRVYEIHREQYGVRESAAVKILSFPRDSDEVAEILHSGYVEETLAAEYHQQVENVLREYRVLMKLKGNPNIVICDTYDVVPHEDGIGSDVFIRMELLTPLKKYLIGNPATPERAVQLGVAMCDALSCCWKHKILHRDIKPENILVSNDGIFKLSDFGEAKLVEKTMASGVAGTWSFVAPEVGNHNRYSEPADIYSLGMVLYWMLNYSMLPFLPRPWGLCTMAEQDEARNRRLSGEPLPPPAEGSPALQAVVLKACSFRPEDRYARPEEFRAALLAALEPGADEPSANWQRAQAENRPVDNDAPTADEGSMGNNWVSGGSPLHEATMPTDDDDDPTMPDPTKTAQTGSRASSHANAQPVKGNDLYREVTIPASETAIGCTVRVADATGKMLEAKVPQNCQNGKVLRIKGHGYPSPNGGENGDLYITVQVKTEIPTYDEGSMGNNWVSGGSPLHEATMPTDDDDDPTMPDPTKTAQTGSRASSHANAQPVKGNDLYREVTIPASETAIGCTVRVADATGKMLEAKVPQNCQNGKVLRIKGHGYPSPNGGENGDLYITVQVKTEHATEYGARGHTKSPAEGESTSKKTAGLGSIYIAAIGGTSALSFDYIVSLFTDQPTQATTGSIMLMLLAGVIGGLVGKWIIYPFRLESNSDETPNAKALDICLSGASIGFLGMVLLRMILSEEVLDNLPEPVLLIPLGVVLLMGLIARIVYHTKKKEE